MLHVHPVVGASSASERAAADVYQDELAERAARHGFGYVDRKRAIANPTAAAAYLSSYFVAGKKGKMTLREAVTSGRMPVSIVYVAPELSQASGITMRSLRLRRYLWRLDDLWMHMHRFFSFGLEDLVRAHRCGLDPLQVFAGAVWSAGP
jgi:hypothetical protein